MGRLEEPVPLREGSSALLGAGGIPVPRSVVEAARPGDQISLDDSALLLTVEEAGPDRLTCRVERGGLLKSRKSLALLGREVDSPTLTAEDRANLAQAGRFGVTHVLQPFVRGREDLLTLRSALAELGLDQVKIMAKIENRRGMEKLDEILEEADVICIARGDLGNSMPLWELPSCPEAHRPNMPGGGKTLLCGDPAAVVHGGAGGAHPGGGERHLQCGAGRLLRPDAHRRDRRGPPPPGGHGVPGQNRPVRPAGFKPGRIAFPPRRGGNRNKNIEIGRFRTMENVKQILFVNACMRGPERSRTWKLCQTFLNACKNRWPEAEIRERDLTAAPLPVLTTELDDRRHQRFPEDPRDPMFGPAHEVAQADLVVIGAPYWDLTFPAALKVYLEWASMLGVTFRYTQEGEQVGMSRAGELVFITTAGGPLEGQNYGFDYLKGLAAMFGIPSARCLSAQELDIQGNDPEAILREAQERAAALAAEL